MASLDFDRHMDDRRNLMSLPRELRDQIYRELVISSQPVHFNRISGPVVCDVDDGLLSSWNVSPQLAKEACQTFYQQNTFVVFDEDLPSFLQSSIHTWLLHACLGSLDSISKGKRVDHKVSAWITKVEVFQEQSLCTDDRELGVGLRSLVDCPQLHSVVIDTGRGFWRKLDEHSKLAIEDLTKRIGAGLKVHMEGSGYRSGVEYII